MVHTFWERKKKEEFVFVCILLCTESMGYTFVLLNQHFSDVVVVVASCSPNFFSKLLLFGWFFFSIDIFSIEFICYSCTKKLSWLSLKFYFVYISLENHAYSLWKTKRKAQPNDYRIKTTAQNNNKKLFNLALYICTNASTHWQIPWIQGIDGATVHMQSQRKYSHTFELSAIFQ